MNRKLIQTATLCALLSFPLHSKTHPAVTQRLADCGKTYGVQFEEALEAEKMRELTKEERKSLKEKEIPYAMARNIGVGIHDFDKNGTDDYLGFKSKSAVEGCAVSSKPFQKSNELYLEINGEAKLNESWTGELILAVEVYSPLKIVTIKHVDRDGEISYKRFTYR